MTFRWGTVTAVSPLRVRLDGDSTELPFTPESLIDPRLLAANDRVRCEMSGRRLIVVGRSTGLGVLGLRQIVRFTSSGTFDATAYPWLRAVLIRMVGGGGGGGGAATTGASTFSAGGGGGGACYGERFITDLSLLASPVTVTVGAGGSAGAAGASGGTGGTSSFGSLLSADGGGGGTAGEGAQVALLNYGGGGVAGETTVGADLRIPGERGGIGYVPIQFRGYVGAGGASHLSPRTVNSMTGTALAGGAAQPYGCGGRGGIVPTVSTAGVAGGAGSAGIVIVELYA